MKKLNYVYLLLLLIPAVGMAGSKVYPGFSATAMTNISVPMAMVSVDFLSPNLYPHVMRSQKGLHGGGLGSHGKVDNFYPKPPTSQRYLIQMSIDVTDYGGNNPGNKIICTLRYNLLSRQADWIVNKSYKIAKNYPAVRCKKRLYDHHIFLILSDTKS